MFNYKTFLVPVSVCNQLRTYECVYYPKGLSESTIPSLFANTGP